MSRATATHFVTGLLLLQVSCSDLPTAPTPGPLHPTAPATRSLLVPETGAAEFIVGSEAPLKGDVQSLGYYPWPTVVFMKVHQYFSITMVPPYPSGTGEIGLSGRGWGWGCSHQGEAYVVTYFDGGGYGFPFEGCQLPDPGTDRPITTFSDTILVMGQVNYGYTLDSACPYPDTACAAYSGSSGVELKRVPLTDFDIQGDSVHDGVLEVWPNLDYEIAATPNPFTMGRQWTPMTVMGWKFQPDTGAAADAACSNGTGRVCVANFRHAGTLTVEAVVNGDRITSKPIRVRMPTISLEVSRADPVVGDTIEVTTTITGANLERLKNTLIYALFVDPAAVTTTSDTPVLAASLATTRTTSSGDTARNAAVVSLATTDSAPSASSAPTPALKPCLGVYPAPTHCYIVVTKAGRYQVYGLMSITNRLHLHADKWITVHEATPCGGSGQANLSASSVTAGTPVRAASLSTSCAEETPTISITRAAGPNGSAGSFTTIDTESTITLVAAVTPASAAGSVKWAVTPNLAGTYRPRAITTPIPDGATSRFRVPASVLADTARWPHAHPDALGDVGLGRKVMAYTVLASVTVNSNTVTSAPVIVKQDADDVLRQEYIDWRKNRVIARSEIKTPSDPALNSGDYARLPTNAPMDSGYPRLQDLALVKFGRQLSISGGFRNPVHHHYHIGTGQVPESNHLYAGALDFSIRNPPTVATTPESRGPRRVKQLTEKEYWVVIGLLAHDPTVGGCYEPEDTIRRASRDHTLNHAHISWLTIDCPDRW